MKDELDFDTACFSLVPLPVETWGPFIFVNPDRQARPLGETLGNLPELVAAIGLDLGAIRRQVRHTFEVAANWKVVNGTTSSTTTAPSRIRPSATSLTWTSTP
jgi:phenylpropionate dioxygenase-like ring-hydroxylating dioxygenase large terminal subunit